MLGPALLYRSDPILVLNVAPLLPNLIDASPALLPCTKNKKVFHRG